MRVAITIFGSTISPLFDTAQQLLLAEISGGDVQIVGKEPLGTPEAPDRISILTRLGVQVLVCGAINRFLHDGLCERGIKVYPWVSGEVTEVLELLRARWAGGQSAHRGLAITVARQPDQSYLTSSVHGCTQVVLIDRQGRTLRSLDIHASAGGRECSKLALLLIDAGVGVLLTRTCGPNAVGLLSAAGIQVFTGVEGGLDAAVERFRQVEAPSTPSLEEPP